MNTPEQPTQWKLFWQIFHKLWGQNKAGDYSKATWMDFQEMALDLQDAAKRVEPSVVAKTDLGIKDADVNAGVKATRQNYRLRSACELTLLFYAVGPWTDSKRREWSEITKFLLGEPSEATTKVLCDSVRAALEA